MSDSLVVVNEGDIGKAVDRATYDDHCASRGTRRNRSLLGRRIFIRTPARRAFKGLVGRG